MFAKELVDLQPDVILTNNTPATAALQRATHTIPIVFVNVADPVGVGFVEGLPRPGGNLTGFINIEAEMGNRGKTRGIGMIIRFPRPRESDSLRACRRPTILTAFRTPN